MSEIVTRDCDSTESESFRIGKWTNEEEQYASKLIQLFFSGCEYIGATECQTLRAFLAIKLNCSRMRISKKFCAMDQLGRKFKLCTSPNHSDTNEASKEILSNLEFEFLLKDQEVQRNRIKRRKYYCDSEGNSKHKSRKIDAHYSAFDISQNRELFKSLPLSVTDSQINHNDPLFELETGNDFDILESNDELQLLYELFEKETELA
mmetsp:Transcript_33374/g.34001  ORF Transcript_33374/g.34001 Transcript_33374/m.34001 type:complete len:206 (-) Transcript_33374:90-707(-)